MPVKSMEYWIKYHWWGYQKLEWLSNDCCWDDALPAPGPNGPAWYSVYVYGAGPPILIRRLS